MCYNAIRIAHKEARFMKNIPEVRLGVVAVSRDCFPITLSHRRRTEVVAAFRKAGGEIFAARFRDSADIFD